MFLTLSTPELLCEEPSADWLIYHTPPVISRGFYYMTLKKKRFAAQNQASVSGHFRYRSEFLKVFWSHACDFLRPTAALVWLPVSTFHSSEVTAAMRADITASTCQVLAQPLAHPLREESICSLDAASWLTGVVPTGYVITAHIKLKKNQGLHLHMDALDWKNASIYSAWTSLALTYVAFSRCK